MDRPEPRGGAYLTLTAIGAVLVVIGTLVSNEPVVGALVAVVVAAAARFAGNFGGYFGASVSPIVLAYVLAASVPAPMDAIPDRLLGLGGRRDRGDPRRIAPLAPARTAHGARSRSDAAGARSLTPSRCWPDRAAHRRRRSPRWTPRSLT